jgi:hypothetical protein
MLHGCDRSRGSTAENRSRARQPPYGPDLQASDPASEEPSVKRHRGPVDSGPDAERRVSRIRFTVAGVWPSASFWPANESRSVTLSCPTFVLPSAGMRCLSTLMR